jgi:hypothetical protein
MSEELGRRSLCIRFVQCLGYCSIKGFGLFVNFKIFKIKLKSGNVKVSNEERSECVSPGTRPTQTHSDLCSPSRNILEPFH